MQGLYHDTAQEYKKLDRQASDIVTKLKNYVTRYGYKENLGQKELGQFIDKLHASDLTYQEQYQLQSMLTQAIDNV